MRGLVDFFYSKCCAKCCFLTIPFCRIVSRIGNLPIEGVSVFRREYNINSYYSLLNSGHEQGKNILYPNLFHLAAVGGVPV